MSKSFSDMSPAPYPNTRLLIDGAWVDAQSGATLDVVNPASGEVIGTVAKAGAAELEQAVEASRRGFEAWRRTPSNERAAKMRVAAGLLRERADRIAVLLTQEQGKPLAEAKGEVLAGADIIEWFADEGRRVYGRIVPSRNLAARQLVLKEPVGPVAAFTPWNFPINQIVRKMGAALATGCSFLLKAPEETPASPAALLQTFLDAGIPPGTIGLVYGVPNEISEYLIRHPVIRKITFTGSTAVGKQLASMAGLHMKRATMELGGHAPVIVTESANVDLAAKALSAAKFRNAGQVCISPTRFLVSNRIRPAFTDAFIRHAQAVKVGDGLQEGTTMGPLANPRRLIAIRQLVDEACKRGATLATGGKQLGATGNFYSPTVLVDVPLDAEICNSEPFGPVAAIRGFDDLEEAIAEANRLPYGLAAYAFSSSVAEVHRLTDGVETGMLWVNQAANPTAEMPFGGVKDSGYGSEGGPEAMEAYLNTKTAVVLSG